MRRVSAAVLQLRMTLLLAKVAASLRRRDTTATLRHFATRPSRWRAFEPMSGLRAVRRASRAVRAQCLSQSVALTIALKRAGYEPTLVLGCRRYEGGTWGAHAWVRLSDEEVLDPIPSGVHQALARLDAGTGYVPMPVAETCQPRK
jgi:hypothetical protein